uniref:Uncharacterized protein n=1 Tax=uncultured bacterium contig00017 TaxID=1181508 RepID=A0A806KF49_9BACT|nr:hypothetical protein [uncultured bacterium contig00017]
MQILHEKADFKSPFLHEKADFKQQILHEKADFKWQILHEKADFDGCRSFNQLITNPSHFEHIFPI